LEVSHAEPSDEQLMARMQSSDPAALGTLFDRYGRLVMSIALRTLRDHGEAEDTVQEVFLYLYRKATLFDPQKGSAKGWILQLAFHRALDRKLFLARRGFYIDSQLSSSEGILPVSAHPHHERAEKLDRSALERALVELSDIQRETLKLFYFEGMNLHEIASRFDCTLSNVRHYYYRALERLRKSAFIQPFSRRTNDVL
jgi:RNA polymerase sigma-70 factor (ECF subfamily)